MGFYFFIYKIKIMSLLQDISIFTYPTKEIWHKMLQWYTCLPGATKQGHVSMLSLYSVPMPHAVSSSPTFPWLVYSPEIQARRSVPGKQGRS